MNLRKWIGLFFSKKKIINNNEPLSFKDGLKTFTHPKIEYY